MKKRRNKCEINQKIFQASGDLILISVKIGKSEKLKEEIAKS